MGGVARTLISGKVPVRHLPLLRTLILHGVTDAARQEVGEELKGNEKSYSHISKVKFSVNSNYSGWGHVRGVFWRVLLESGVIC